MIPNRVYARKRWTAHTAYAVVVHNVDTNVWHIEWVPDEPGEWEICELVEPNATASVVVANRRARDSY